MIVAGEGRETGCGRRREAEERYQRFDDLLAADEELTPARSAAGRGRLTRVRLSDFWQLMDGEFGRAYARSLAADQVMADLADRTASQALDAGVRPRDVWVAVCDAMSVPPKRRAGQQHRAGTTERSDIPPVLR
ncbi:MAG TPA: DUF3046 domain-containing protein [Actinomycetales bacterium]|nr:DUF3046 domain-containing protein [Actinomycetales bacterium]